MERSYEEAIRWLNSRKASPKPNLDNMRGSDGIVEWLELLGHPAEDINGLNAIHVAGTNGKGSTCAFAASLLAAHGSDTGYPRKIGLYTSPHMKDIRERIRINARPPPTLEISRYLQLLAILSFHIFIEEKVDVAIYEAHLGGEFDATNVIKIPLMTAITPISMDHHKAGIFKSGSLAFSAPQEPNVATVLEQRAAEKGVVLEFVGIDNALPTDAEALKAKAQRTNCSLALAVVRAWISVKAPEGQCSMEENMVRGIEQFFWPGRYQQINERNCQWFFDGAHNEIGLQYAVDWFAEMATENQRHVVMSIRNTVTPTRILIFSQFSRRDVATLLRIIAESLQYHRIHIQYVILTTYDERRDGQRRIDRNLTKSFSAEIQRGYAETWRNLDPKATVLCERTIQDALDRAREIGDQNNGMQALVTGSLHLVSGALCLLESYCSLQRVI
ncbi:folylpolyglutamate synthase [Bisporella sp. PMI_857]|nr:folylpolyglutamate synthase [Bisporella sp. PMI_857]